MSEEIVQKARLVRDSREHVNVVFLGHVGMYDKGYCNYMKLK